MGPSRLSRFIEVTQIYLMKEETDQASNILLKQTLKQHYGDLFSV